MDQKQNFGRGKCKMRKADLFAAASDFTETFFDLTSE